MFCSKCSTQNNDTNKFCANCGSSLNNNSNNTNSDEETSLILGIICLVSSFFLNIICFVPGIISIVFASKYKKQSGKFCVGFGLSLTGMIFSIIVLFFIIFIFSSFFNFIENVIPETDNNTYPEYTYNIPSV